LRGKIKKIILCVAVDCTINTNYNIIPYNYRNLFDNATETTSKIMSKVFIPDVINVERFTEAGQAKYTLTSAIVHVGGSANTGHLVALQRYGKFIYKYSDEKVLHFNLYFNNIYILL